MPLIQSHFFVLFLVAFGLLVYAHQFAVLRKTSLLAANLPTLQRTSFAVNASPPIVASTPVAAPSACSPLMTPAQFRLDTEVYGCFTTGVPGEVKAGVPLDQTMKSFLTEPCGFFIEAGAQDGVFQSNTLIFARKFGYTGLLVEPDVRSITIFWSVTAGYPKVCAWTFQR